MKKILQAVLFCFSLAMAGITPAGAALYTGSYGTLAPAGSNDPSDCDDCYSAFISFGGGQTINFFGTTYSGLYISSNGYVTFGNGVSDTHPGPLDTQNDAPMMAPLATDLYSSGDASSNVYYNDSTTGQLIITWENMGHCCDYTYRSTFQLVVRSDQFSVPGGEGQVGLFWGNIDDTNNGTAGFGEGTGIRYVGEQNYYNASSSGLSNHAPVWFTSVPTTRSIAPAVAIPTLSEWGMLLMSILLAIAAVFTLRRG